MANTSNAFMFSATPTSWHESPRQAQAAKRQSLKRFGAVPISDMGVWCASGNTVSPFACLPHGAPAVYDSHMRLSAVTRAQQLRALPLNRTACEPSAQAVHLGVPYV